MHYLTYIVVPKEVVYGEGRLKKDLAIMNLDEVNSYIDSVMEYFYCDRPVPEYKEYLDKHEIKRMKEQYKVATEKALVKHMKDWNSIRGGYDKNGLYKISTYNKDGLFDYYVIGGRWGGFIKGMNSQSESISDNIIRIKDFDENKSCHNIILGQMTYKVFDSGHADWVAQYMMTGEYPTPTKESYDEFKKQDIKIFKELIKKLKEERPDDYIVVLDTHS